MQAKTTFLKQLSQVSSLAMLSRIMGFGREVCQLSLIGIGSLSDAFTTALMLPAVLRKLTSEGLFNAAFIPIYHEISTQYGQEAADQWTKNIICKILLISVVFLLIFELFVPYFLTFLAPGFIHKPTWQLLIILTRIMAITIAGSTISSLINSFWTAQKKYFLASIGSTICNIGIITYTLFAKDVYQAAWGMVFGVYLQMIITLIPMKKRIFRKHAIKNIFKLQTKHFISLLWPLIASGVVLQGLGLISAWFGSWLIKGQFTYLNKAEKLLLLPISLIGVTLNTVLVPTLTKRMSSAYITYSIRIALMLSALVMALFFSLRNEFAYLAFKFGKITTHNILQIAQISRALLLGLPGWILLKIGQASLASMKNTKINLAGNLLHMICYGAFGLTLISKLDMFQLALISVTSLWINTSFIIMQLWKKGLIKNILKYTLFISITTGLAVLLHHQLIINTQLLTHTQAILNSIRTCVIYTIIFTLIYKAVIKWKI